MRLIQVSLTLGETYSVDEMTVKNSSGVLLISLSKDSSFEEMKQMANGNYGITDGTRLYYFTCSKV